MATSCQKAIIVAEALIFIIYSTYFRFIFFSEISEDDSGSVVEHGVFMHGHAVPCLCQLQGCQDEKCKRVCKMDDVLDRFRNFQICRDLYGRVFLILVPILLRNKDRASTIPPISLHQRLLSALPPVRPPRISNEGTGDR